MNAGRPIMYNLWGLLSVFCLCGCMRGASSAGEWMNASRGSRRWGRCSGRSRRRGWRWCRRSSAGSRRLGKEAYSRSGTPQRRENTPAILLVDVISNRRPPRRGVAWKIVEFRVRIMKLFSRRGFRRSPVPCLRVPERRKV